VFITLLIYLLTVAFAYYAFRRLIKKIPYMAGMDLIIAMFVPAINVIWGCCALWDSMDKKETFAKRFFGIKEDK
jgi:hypothetical protein